MNLYLVRHGDADKPSTSKPDFERELTQKGRDSIKKAAEGWKNIIQSFDIIVSSPLKRAVQTAEIIANVFDYSKKIITDKRIASGSKPDDLIDFLRSLNNKNIAVVGHEPDLAHNISALTSSSGMYTEFRKGTIAKINFEGRIRLSGGTLEFLIPADTFK
jgi:phosphohistidine phosphatase